MKIIVTLFVALLFTVFYNSPVFGQSVVVPNQLENVSGDGGAFAGFDCTGMNGFRIQTLFAGSQLPQGTIISLAVRSTPNSLPFGPAVFPNIIINMSTTDKQPGGLDANFADNIGPDVTTVYQGPFPITFPDCAGLDPCPFATPIEFQNPFPYDPDDGNLLLEYIIPPCNPPDGLPVFDTTIDLFPDIVQSVLAADQNADSGSLGAVAPITQFNFILVAIPQAAQIPALSQWGLIAVAVLIGLAGLILVQRWNSKSS